MKFFSCTHIIISIQSNFVYYALYKWSNNYSDRKPIVNVVKNTPSHISKKLGTIPIFTIVTVKDVRKDIIKPMIAPNNNE